jgi:serine/threonine protein kinase
MCAFARAHVTADNLLITAEGKVKIIDFGAAADMSTGINFNPLYGMLDPRYSPPEELIMPQGGCQWRARARTSASGRAHVCVGTGSRVGRAVAGWPEEDCGGVCTCLLARAQVRIRTCLAPRCCIADMNVCVCAYGRLPAAGVSPCPTLARPARTSDFPRAPNPGVAALLAPLAWVYGRPDLFDSYSVGVLLMQVGCLGCREWGSPLFWAASLARVRGCRLVLLTGSGCSQAAGSSPRRPADQQPHAAAV